MSRTDVLLDVNWHGRETESGNVIYGWHLGSVCVIETVIDDFSRLEVYVSHPDPESEAGAIVLHWAVFDTRAEAMQRHDVLVKELREVGEHGMYARLFESVSEAKAAS